MIYRGMLFERPLMISSDFLKRIITSNCRDMRNYMSVVFGLLKMSFWVPKKGQLSFSEWQYDLRFSRNGQKKSPNKFKNTSSPRKIEQIKLF